MNDTIKESLSSFVDKPLKTPGFDTVLGRNILISPTEEQFEQLLQRLRQQLGEGRGEVILEVVL